LSFNIFIWIRQFKKILDRLALLTLSITACSARSYADDRQFNHHKCVDEEISCNKAVTKKEAIKMAT